MKELIYRPKHVTAGHNLEQIKGEFLCMLSVSGHRRSQSEQKKEGLSSLTVAQNAVVLTMLHVSWEVTVIDPFFISRRFGGS